MYKNFKWVEEKLEEEIKETKVAESIAKNRPRREIRKPTRFEDMVAFAFPIVERIPNSYKDAIQGSKRSEWTLEFAILYLSFVSFSSVYHKKLILFGLFCVFMYILLRTKRSQFGVQIDQNTLLAYHITLYGNKNQDIRQIGAITCYLFSGERVLG